jgi:hypothetical protein
MPNGDIPKTLPPDYFDKKAPPPQTLPPDYFSKIETPDAVKQAQAAVRRPLEELQPKTRAYSIFTPTGITGTEKELEKVRGAQHAVTVGAFGMAGGEGVAGLVPGAEAAAGSSGFLKWLLPMLTRASGVGAGAGAGALVSGEKPKEALATASQFTSMEAGGETGLKVLSKAGETKVGKLVKSVFKSKVKALEEAHAAETAKIEAEHQKKLTEHKEAKQQVMQDYREALQKHTAETKEASATESAVKAKKGIAVQHQNDMAGLLKQNLELADEKIATSLGKEFDKVHEAVQAKGPDVDIAPVQKAAVKAKEGLLFEDSRTAFDRVMASIEPSEDLPSRYQIIPREPSAQGLISFQDAITGGSVEMKEGFTEAELAEKLKKSRAEMAKTEPNGKSQVSMDKAARAAQAGQYSDLRRAYTKLNEYLYGGGEIPTDLYKAVKPVRDALGNVLQKSADSVGLGGKFSKVMNDWSEYKSTFHDKSAIAKGGSPIRRILDAEDPAFVIDQLKGKAGDRLIEEIGKYQKYGADKALAGRLKGFIEQVKAMPSTAGELPAAPKRPTFPKAPEKPEITPFEREAISREIMAQRIKRGVGAAGLGGGGAALYEWLRSKGHPSASGGAVP